MSSKGIRVKITVTLGWLIGLSITSFCLGIAVAILVMGVGR